MPHVLITVSTGATTCRGITCSPVVGFTPALASVAAMTARSRAVTTIEHWRKYISTWSSTSWSSSPAERIR